MSTTKQTDKEWEKVQEKLRQLERKCQSLTHKLETVSNKKTKIEHSGDFWASVSANCRKKAGPFGELAIKAMIKSGEATVNDHTTEGDTLLMIAAKRGAFDLAQFLINNGADLDAVNDKGFTALQLSQESNYPHLEKLLLFSKLNIEAGNDIKEIVQTVQKQSGINQVLADELAELGEQTKGLYEKTLMELMVTMIQKRRTFCDNQLVYAFNMAINNDEEFFLKSELWLQIRRTVSDIVQNGTKRDWVWLKVCLLPSMIWYKDISKEMEKKDEAHYLYFELLKLVNVEAMNQINKLETSINKMADEQKDDWNALVEWSNPNKNNEVRQDKIVNGIATRFSYEQLSESSGTKFNSPNFYDYNQYLSQLVLLAQIVDEEFHESVQKIFDVNLLTNKGQVAINAFGKEDDEKEILGNGIVEYMRGPVKLIERARAKAQNDYVTEPFPSSACVIDFNRCALIFDDISSLLRGLKLFVNKVKYYQSGNIIDIARDKNGFIEYIKMPQYADVKLNVVIKGKYNSIIGEVQFLLRAMKEYKDKAHNLYAIQRKEEMMNGSVSKIMPILMDREKEIVGFACRGDVKNLYSLMILQNQSVDDIDNFTYRHRETIWDKICEFGNLKLAKALASMMNQSGYDGLFIKHMTTRNPYIDYPFSSSEIAISNSHLPLVKYLFDMKEVQAAYKDNDKSMTALLISIFVFNQNEHLTKYVLSTLGISKEKVIETLGYESPTNDYEYQHEGINILGALVKYGTFDHLQKFIAYIGKKAFLKNIFEEDRWYMTPMDHAITVNKVKVIDFLLSFDEIKQKYLTDDDESKRLSFRLWKTCCDNVGNKKAVQYCVDNLNCTAAKVEWLEQLDADFDFSPLSTFI